jgi:hypothetical protein
MLLGIEIEGAYKKWELPELYEIEGDWSGHNTKTKYDYIEGLPDWFKGTDSSIEFDDAWNGECLCDNEDECTCEENHSLDTFELISRPLNKKNFLKLN